MKSHFQRLLGIRRWVLLGYLLLGFSVQIAVAQSEHSAHSKVQIAEIDAAITEPHSGIKEMAVNIGAGITIDFVWISPGEFVMGSPTNEIGRGEYDYESQHQVTLTKGFWMGKYEVTQEQWEKVMGSNPSERKGLKFPVSNVSWTDCHALITALNGTNRPLSVIQGAFRLPTEAEWEYACRAGTETAYAGNLDDMAWYSKTGNMISEVGRKTPNAWSLYDMHGNVSEWCEDWTAGDYPEGSVTNPTGPLDGELHILRGGGWGSMADDCRSANRINDWPETRFMGYGLRLVLSE